jgi:ParB/RepB/Spo0J family partition protein
MRRDLGDVESLAASLDAYGQLAPVVCYETADGTLCLIAGERRLEATRRLHATRLEAGTEPIGSVGEIDVLVRRLVAGQTPAELELIENEQRRELTDEEEADAFIQLARDQRYKLQQLASLSGRSVAYISKRIRLFEDPRLREAIRHRHIAASQAEELLGLPEDTRAVLVERSIAEGWTHDRMREAARSLLDPDGQGTARVQTTRGSDGLRSFRVENSGERTLFDRPADLIRRVRELDELLSSLEAFQLTKRDTRALAALRRTLDQLAAEG